MKTVAILDPFLDQAIAIAKYIKKYGDGFKVFACFEGKIRSFSGVQWFDESVSHSFDNASLFTRYDYVIPTGAYSTYKLLSTIETLQVGNVEFKSSNLVLYDKLKTLDIAERLGIPTPATFDRIDKIENLPVFYKEPFETGGGKRGIVRTPEELAAIAVYENLIYQEYINTPVTYGVGFLAKEGTILTSFLHREILSTPKAGGSGVVLERITSDQRLFEYTRLMISELNYSGWGLSEFKYCERRHDFVLMEINTKFWASVEFAFLNNSTFLRELFDIDYPEQDIAKVIFLDRLMSLGLLETLRNQGHIRGTHKLNVKKIPQMLPLFLFRTLVPSKIRSRIRENG
jgi:hypothetical protein